MKITVSSRAKNIVRKADDLRRRGTCCLIAAEEKQVLHPDASPGPHDSHYLFKDFVEMMEEWKG